MSKIKIKYVAITGIFAAVIAATAWISIPIPIGVNLTLQIFGVCLAGFYLGAKRGVAATAVYIVMGAVGLPVFSLFTGGAGVLLGTSGGFLWGFLFTAFLCGLSVKINSKILKIVTVLSAVLICHIIGVIQFCLVSGVNIWAAFLSASLPFLPKDIIVAFVASFVAQKIKKLK